MTRLETLIEAGDIAAKRCITCAKTAAKTAAANATYAAIEAAKAANAAEDAAKAIEEIEVAFAAIQSYCSGQLSAGQSQKTGRTGEPQ